MGDNEECCRAEGARVNLIIMSFKTDNENCVARILGHLVKEMKSARKVGLLLNRSSSLLEPQNQRRHNMFAMACPSNGENVPFFGITIPSLDFKLR